MSHIPEDVVSNGKTVFHPNIRKFKRVRLLLASKLKHEEIGHWGWLGARLILGPVKRSSMERRSAFSAYKETYLARIFDEPILPEM